MQDKGNIISLDGATINKFNKIIYILTPGTIYNDGILKGYTFIAECDDVKIGINGHDNIFSLNNNSVITTGNSNVIFCNNNNHILVNKRNVINANDNNIIFAENGSTIFFNINNEYETTGKVDVFNKKKS